MNAFALLQLKVLRESAEMIGYSKNQNERENHRHRADSTFAELTKYLRRNALTGLDCEQYEALVRDAMRWRNAVGAIKQPVPAAHGSAAVTPNPTAEVCTGQFSDARDCPIHNPNKRHAD